MVLCCVRGIVEVGSWGERMWWGINTRRAILARGLVLRLCGEGAGVWNCMKFQEMNKLICNYINFNCVFTLIIKTLFQISFHFHLSLYK